MFMQSQISHFELCKVRKPLCEPLKAIWWTFSSTFEKLGLHAWHRLPCIHIPSYSLKAWKWVVSMATSKLQVRIRNSKHLFRIAATPERLTCTVVPWSGLKMESLNCPKQLQIWTGHLEKGPVRSTSSEIHHVRGLGEGLKRATVCAAFSKPTTVRRITPSQLWVLFAHRLAPQLLPLIFLSWCSYQSVFQYLQTLLLTFLASEFRTYTNIHVRRHSLWQHFARYHPNNPNVASMWSRAGLLKPAQCWIHATSHEPYFLISSWNKSNIPGSISRYQHKGSQISTNKGEVEQVT